MWRNWAGNQSMQPAALERPSSTDDVSRLVKQAAADGQRVKAIGSGHSFTAIGLTDGVLLDLGAMDRVLTVDHAAHRVTVQAGLVLHELNAALARQGLALTNMGDIDVQTVAGAISTGTHGTGRDSGALATQVVGLELVLADGSVLTCSADEHPEVFAVARVGLGALGVVTAVTLQVEPAFLLTADERPMPLDDVLRDLELHAFRGLGVDVPAFDLCGSTDRLSSRRASGRAPCAGVPGRGRPAHPGGRRPRRLRGLAVPLILRQRLRSRVRSV